MYLTRCQNKEVKKWHSTFYTDTYQIHTLYAHIKHIHWLQPWNFLESFLFQIFCPGGSSYLRPSSLHFSFEKKNLVSGSTWSTSLTLRVKFRFWFNRYFLNTFSWCRVGVSIQYLVKSEDIYYMGHGIFFFWLFSPTHEGLMTTFLNQIFDA